MKRIVQYIFIFTIFMIGITGVKAWEQTPELNEIKGKSELPFRVKGKSKVKSGETVSYQIYAGDEMSVGYETPAILEYPAPCFEYISFEGDNLYYDVALQRLSATKKKGNTYQKGDWIGTLTLKVRTTTPYVFSTVAQYAVDISRKGNPEKYDENKSDNYYLKSLTVEGLELSPKFQSEQYVYQMETTKDHIVVNAETLDKKASIKGTGTHQLKMGENVIPIAVTSENNDTHQYQLVIIRNKGNESMTGVLNATMILMTIIFSGGVGIFMYQNKSKRRKKKTKASLFVKILFGFFILMYTYTFVLIGMKIYFYDRLDQIIKKLPQKDTVYSVQSGKIYDLRTSKQVSSFLGGNGYIFINQIGDIQAKIQSGPFCIEQVDQTKQIHTKTCDDISLTYQYTGKEQTFIVPIDGTYQIELWGASGGHALSQGHLNYGSGEGAYTKGTIHLKKGEIIYLHIGGQGENGRLNYDGTLTPFGYPGFGGQGGYNGGGKGADDPQSDPAGGGGGATDIRLVSGKWDDFDSLKSRIMVAAGGGGSTNYQLYQASSDYIMAGKGGSGGDTEGNHGYPWIGNLNQRGYGATQILGYAFGKGQDGDYCKSSMDGLAGGGSGYMGAYAGVCNPGSWKPAGGAGGGSSYVSGCKGCNAISKASTENNIIYTNQPIHYSKKKFDHIQMIDGNSKMPDENGHTILGNRGNGFAKITLLKK